MLPEAAGLGFAALTRRILEVLLDLDPATADESRALAERNADVFVEPGPAGRVTLGAELPAEEAAEGVDFLNTLAQQAKADGDPRPIGQLRAELFSLLVRGAAIGADGARASLTITAALEALEGASTAPAEVNGFAITSAHLAGLLRRIGALGLQTPPDGGSLTFATTDATGRLIATVSREQLEAGPPRRRAHPAGGHRELHPDRRAAGVPRHPRPHLPAPVLRAAGRLGRPRPRRRPLPRRADRLHQPVLPVPHPPPAENPLPRVAVRHGTRRHPARHHPVRYHPHHPTVGDATATTTAATARPGRRPATVLTATRMHVGTSTCPHAGTPTRPDGAGRGRRCPEPVPTIGSVAGPRPATNG
ncbi:hypothetical protein [Geodermatophilus sp. URMC 64]